MTPSFSTYLNGARVVAALAVLVSHWSHPAFTGGAHAGLRSLWLGTDAVVVFFVLSGLVIAWTADTKDRTLGRFAFNRITRMYSVVLPAILLTLALDAAGSALDPAFYARSWRWDTPLAGQVWSVLLFGVDVWFNRERLGTNGPFWSLSYEFWYYALFAAACYLRGAQRLLCGAALLAAIGYTIPLLLPCWLLGVAVYRRIVRPPGSAVVGWVMAVLPVLLYIQLQRSGTLVDLARLPLDVLGVRVSGFYLGNAQFALREYVVATLAAAHLIGVAAVLQAGGRATAPAGARRVDWAAGATFSLYVTHAPVLHFLRAAAPAWPELYIPACIGVALAFAWAFERRLGAFRRRLAALPPARLRSLAGVRPPPG